MARGADDPIDCSGTIYHLDEWPNCAMPDCEYKSCLSLNSKYCYAHTVGDTPIPFEEYMRRGVKND